MEMTNLGTSVSNYQQQSQEVKRDNYQIWIFFQIQWCSFTKKFSLALSYLEVVRQTPQHQNSSNSTKLKLKK